MSDTMTKERESKSKGDQSEDPPKRSLRSGTPLHAWIDEDIAAAFQDYVESTDPRVSKTAALETALKEFMRTRGFWPRSARQDK